MSFYVHMNLHVDISAHVIVKHMCTSKCINVHGCFTNINVFGIWRQVCICVCRGVQVC